jgi:hypothetical protein
VCIPKTLSALMRCPFRKFHPAWIRVPGQNRRIMKRDVCGFAHDGNGVRQRIHFAQTA